MEFQFHSIDNQSYKDVWDFQTILHNDIKYFKKSLPRNFTYKTKPNFLNHIVFCEHKHVLTIGKSGSLDNLKTTEHELELAGVELFKINRGGDITYHGPGQLTGYLIFDLEQLYRDVHLFVRNIEECIIRVLKIYDINSFRIKEYTGVWVGEPNNYRKICAIGVHLSRWVSMHGFALNINTNLSYFDKIIPCGIVDENKSVTSLSKELGHKVNFKEVSLHLKNTIQEVFKIKEHRINEAKKS